MYYADRKIRFRNDSPGKVVYRGKTFGLFYRLLLILVENAVKWGPISGRPDVEATIREDKDLITITIANEVGAERDFVENSILQNRELIVRAYNGEEDQQKIGSEGNSGYAKLMHIVLHDLHLKESRVDVSIIDSRYVVTINFDMDLDYCHEK